MPSRFKMTPPPVRPHRLLWLSLVTTFASEYFIMKLLPWILPAKSGDSFQAVVDACLLTLFVAPVLWLVAVRPVQRLADSRMHFLRQALSAQEEERRRITQNLHDGLGQSLTSLMLGLRALQETSTSPEVREQVDVLRQMGADLHTELRRIVRGLRPVILDQLGLVAAIERLVEEVRQTAIPAVEFAASGLNETRLEADIESTAFRIVQEALSNAIQHSDSTWIRVSVTVRGRELELEVSDNGKGFDAPAAVRGKSSGYGLLGIRERATISGGRAEIVASPGTGTIVSVHLPLAVQSATHV